jgi:hypothetical protein
MADGFGESDHDRLVRLETKFEMQLQASLTDRSKLHQDVGENRGRLEGIEKMVSELRGARKLLSWIGVVIGFVAGLAASFLKHP